MPVHDWTRVEAGIFHDFHSAWITELRNALNGGILPSDYYALAEQHAGRSVPDLLTLHASRPNGESSSFPPSGPATALLETPPKVQRTLTAVETYRQRRRTLAIRHVSGDRLIALLEIVSPANKDRRRSVRAFVNKVVAALDFGIHVLLLDLLPPGRHDSRSMHGAVWRYFGPSPYLLPAEEPLTLASYAAGPPVKAYLQHVKFSDGLPEMPLFLQSERYILVPLEGTYQAAYRGVPARWRNVLEGSSS
jgi:hypothetical protein